MESSTSSKDDEDNHKDNRAENNKMSKDQEDMNSPNINTEEERLDGKDQTDSKELDETNQDSSQRAEEQAKGDGITSNNPPSSEDDKGRDLDKSTSGSPPQEAKNILTVDLSIVSQVRDTPRDTQGNTRGDKWTENGRQGGGTSKSVDFSVPVNMDDVDAELARVLDPMNDEELMFDPHDYGRGATTNTPVTVMTDYAESVSQIQGRGLHTPSRDRIYQHALSIMKKRCQSSRTATSKTCTSLYRPKTPENVVEENGEAFPNFSLPAVIANMDKPPLVQNSNCLFYVTQNRQHPFAPIKAWKGYEGNLYFQPVVCKKATISSASTPRENALNKATRRAYSTTLTKTRPPESQATEHLPQLPQSEPGGKNEDNIEPSVVGAHSVRSHRTTAPSRQKSFSRATGTAKSRASTARQLAILDKQSVFSRMDSNLGEDIQWISGLEAMGTLHIGGLKLPRSTAHFYENTRKHHKLKIQRGLVSHQLAANNQSLPTLLGVHGGRLNDSADSVAKTKHLQSQYQVCKASPTSTDQSVYPHNVFEDYSGPFTSIEQLRRDSSSSQRRAPSSPSSDMILKDDSLHSLASVFKNSGNSVPLYSSKEVLFRNREALFLTRPNYR